MKILVHDARFALTVPDECQALAVHKYYAMTMRDRSLRPYRSIGWRKRWLADEVAQILGLTFSPRPANGDWFDLRAENLVPPVKHEPRKTGEKHISFSVTTGRFHLHKCTNRRQRTSRGYATLEEAIAARPAFLAAVSREF